MAECTFQPRTNASKFFKKKRGSGGGGGGGVGKNASSGPSKHRLSQLANANLVRDGVCFSLGASGAPTATTRAACVCIFALTCLPWRRACLVLSCCNVGA